MGLKHRSGGANPSAPPAVHLTQGTTIPTCVRMQTDHTVMRLPQKAQSDALSAASDIRQITYLPSPDRVALMLLVEGCPGATTVGCPAPSLRRFHESARRHHCSELGCTPTRLQSDGTCVASYANIHAHDDEIQCEVQHTSISS